jgi:hypothetical protein
MDFAVTKDAWDGASLRRMEKPVKHLAASDGRVAEARIANAGSMMDGI